MASLNLGFCLALVSQVTFLPGPPPKVIQGLLPSWYFTILEFLPSSHVSGKERGDREGAWSTQPQTGGGMALLLTFHSKSDPRGTTERREGEAGKGILPASPQEKKMVWLPHSTHSAAITSPLSWTQWSFLRPVRSSVNFWKSWQERKSCPENFVFRFPGSNSHHLLNVYCISHINLYVLIYYFI